MTDRGMIVIQGTGGWDSGPQEYPPGYVHGQDWGAVDWFAYDPDAPNFWGRPPAAEPPAAPWPSSPTV